MTQLRTDEIVAQTDRLGEAARMLDAAERDRDNALEARALAVRAAVEAGLTQAQIATALRCTPGRVGQILRAGA